MRKTLIVLTAAATIGLSGAASAPGRYSQPNYAPWLGGAAVGTTVGLGLYHGWFGSGALASSLPASADASPL